MYTTCTVKDNVIILSNYYDEEGKFIPKYPNKVLNIVKLNDWLKEQKDHNRIIMKGYSDFRPIDVYYSFEYGY